MMKLVDVAVALRSKAHNNKHVETKVATPDVERDGLWIWSL